MANRKVVGIMESAGTLSVERARPPQAVRRRGHGRAEQPTAAAWAHLSPSRLVASNDDQAAADARPHTAKIISHCLRGAETAAIAGSLLFLFAFVLII